MHVRARGEEVWISAQKVEEEEEGRRRRRRESLARAGPRGHGRQPRRGAF